MLITCSTIVAIVTSNSNINTSNYITIGYLNVAGDLFVDPITPVPVGLFYLQNTIAYLNIKNAAIAYTTADSLRNFIFIYSVSTFSAPQININMRNFNGNCTFLRIDTYSSVIYANVVNCVTSSNRNIDIVYPTTTGNSYLESSSTNKYVISGCYRAAEYNIYINGSILSGVTRITPLILNSISLVVTSGNSVISNNTDGGNNPVALQIRIYINVYANANMSNTTSLLATLTQNANVI